MSKNKVLIYNTQEKEEISRILNGFINAVSKNFKARKYECAKQLINYKKSDLETAKSDIEFAIDNSRTFAAILAIGGTIITAWLLVVAPLEYRTFISGGITIYLGVLGSFLYFNIGRDLALLHILKIAIAIKPEQEDINKNQTPEL